jgi:transketolase
VGIAEQNMMGVAAGLAREGFIPVTGTYGVFASGRCWDQIRTTICYSNLNVKIAGAHGGISVGPDGATHQSLEELSLTAILPNMRVAVPCDSVETQKATLHCLLKIDGPCYLRFAREATPIVTTPATPFEFGVANVIRFRGVQPKFLDAFETVLSTAYENEREDLAIIACGPMVPEAMRAAWILKEEYGLETRIVNVHTVKPLDEAALVRAAAETGVVLTAEEHQAGGFGNIVAGGILRRREDFRRALLLDMVGVADRFGVSGKPWELVQAFGLTGEHLAERALKLRQRKGERIEALPRMAAPAVVCGRCGHTVAFEQFLAESSAPGIELCADCERRPESCGECRARWALANPGFRYVCRDCREVAVEC